MLQPRAMTSLNLGSVYNITTILSLLSHLFQPCSGSWFPPPLDLSPTAHPYFTHRRRFSLSLHPLLLPHLSWEKSDRPHGRLPHLLASTAHLCFPPMWGGPRISSRNPVTPLCHSQPTPSYLSSPGVSRLRFSSSLYLSPSSARPPSPPPAGLDQCPSPLPFPSG